jgi:hypothetical protein
LELFLNLVWLLTAAGSFVWWRRRFISPGPERRQARRNRVRALALLCALAVYFPVISVSDDLHVQIAVIEDSSGSRRSISSAGSGQVAAHHFRLLNVPSALPSALFPFETLSIAGKVFFGNPSLPVAASSLVPSGRAPPSL